MSTNQKRKKVEKPNPLKLKVAAYYDERRNVVVQAVVSGEGLVETPVTAAFLPHHPEYRLLTQLDVEPVRLFGYTGPFPYPRSGSRRLRPVLCVKNPGKASERIALGAAKGRSVVGVFSPWFATKHYESFRLLACGLPEYHETSTQIQAA